jgi:hypothetical protein
VSANQFRSDDGKLYFIVPDTLRIFKAADLDWMSADSDAVTDQLLRSIGQGPVTVVRHREAREVLDAEKPK